MKRNLTEYIVIHTAAWPGDPSARDIRRVHVEQNGWDDIGYHYVIRKSGTVERGRAQADIGAHCRAGGMNRQSIGICLSGHHDQEAPTYAQKYALAKLCADLMHALDIPVQKVIGHREAGQVNKTCPGTKVNMDKVRTVVKLLIQNRVDPIDAPDLVDTDWPAPELEYATSTTADPLEDITVNKPFGQTGVGQTLLAENRLGTALKGVKNILLGFLPGGRQIAAGTKLIADALRRENSKNRSQKKGNTMPNANNKEKKGLWNWIKRRLREPSTYQGVAAVLAAVGVSMSPEHIEIIGTALAGVIGAVQVIKKELAE